LASLNFGIHIYIYIYIYRERERERERERDPNYFAAIIYLFLPDMQCTRTRALSLSHCSATSSICEIKLPTELRISKMLWSN